MSLARAVTAVRPDGRRRDVAERLGTGVRALVVTAWAVVLAAVGRQTLYVSHDSISNYAHVWYVSDRLRRAHTLPFHMPMLAGGHAFAFPYAFLPWTTAAIARMVLGDRAVTACLVTGFVAVVVLVFRAFPELRNPWCEAIVIVNPALVMALLVGQIPFLWATAFLLAAIAAWRHGRRAWATAFAASAMATHPAVLVPITLLIVVCWLPRVDGRRGLAWRTALATAVAVPAAAIVLRSPAVTQTATWFRIEQLGRIVAARGTVIALPFALLALRHLRVRRALPVVFALVGGLNAVLLGPMNRYAWAAPYRRPDERIGVFIDSPAFRSGATYRVLGFSDGRVSMYRLIQAGGRLDGEFFPESQARRSWPTTWEYSQFLHDRHVDRVIAWHTYDTRWHTNEHELLRRLANDPPCETGVVTVRTLATYPAFDVYDVRRC